MEVAKEGGAFDFVKKLEKGIDTVLDPVTEMISSNLRNNKTHPLYAEMEKLRKRGDISGGERQRVVAWVSCFLLE